MCCVAFTGAVASAQSLPTVSDLERDSLTLRVQINDLKNSLGTGLVTDKLDGVTSKCGSLQEQLLSYMNGVFYANKSYTYFLNNNPKSYKEQYLFNSVFALSDAMGTRNNAIWALCNAKAPTRADLIGALSLLSNAYNGTQNAELWAELADMMK